MSADPDPSWRPVWRSRIRAESLAASPSRSSLPTIRTSPTSRPRLPATTVLNFIRQIPGVCMAPSREEACLRFELPEDREGDIAVVARSGTALGGHARDHDLSQL